MGKGWDTFTAREHFVEYLEAIFIQCLRVLKPGAHGFVWALPRTSHWTATALEDAGFEVRDVVTHLFGQGFPKSLNVSIAIDKSAGVMRARGKALCAAGAGDREDIQGVPGKSVEAHVAVTDAAREWAGWGTALKPAAEHWILVRKPLDGTVAANVQKHGTGALNIDGCRIGVSPADSAAMERCNTSGSGRFHASTGTSYGRPSPSGPLDTSQGRWPANLTLDEEAARMLDEQSGDRPGFSGGGTNGAGFRREYVNGARADTELPAHYYGDSGGASRFFYVAKASTRERKRYNDHPTVKAVELMRWLCRLVTPPNGWVIDPFLGSGSTGVACAKEEFNFIGIERDRQNYLISKHRLRRAFGR